MQFAHDASDRIYRSIVAATAGKRDATLLPILRPYDTIGSTRYVDFAATKPVYPTRTDKCHVSHVVADTKDWEQKAAQEIEEMDEVLRYVKNQSLGFMIPFVLDGMAHQYTPDFLIDIDDGHGENDPLKLILECSGRLRKDKQAKASTAHIFWTESVNKHGGFGRWRFIETTDPWDVKNFIKAKLQEPEPIFCSPVGAF